MHVYAPTPFGARLFPFFVDIPFLKMVFLLLLLLLSGPGQPIEEEGFGETHNKHATPSSLSLSPLLRKVLNRGFALLPGKIGR